MYKSSIGQGPALLYFNDPLFRVMQEECINLLDATELPLNYEKFIGSCDCGVNKKLSDHAVLVSHELAGEMKDFRVPEAG